MSCQGCEKRELGCRTDCPDWAEHERKKAERYAQKKAEIDSNYDSVRIKRMSGMKKREIRNGRRAR